MIKTRLDVSLDHPSVSGFGAAKLVQGLKTIHGAPSWPKSIGEVEEIRLPNGFHEHFKQSLNRPVLQGRYS